MDDIVCLSDIAKELNLELPEDVSEIGKKSELVWIDIAQLNIDKSFQRKVFRTGKRNIVKIATNFDWKKFGAIQVALFNNKYIIVDGQHRTIAAFLRGIHEVPCNVIEATKEEQALAFVSINAGITAVSPLSTFKAEVAAGLEDSIRLVEICRRANVTINAYPVDNKVIKPGHTIALGCLKKSLKVYGEEHLIFALRSITETAADMNRGLLRDPVIKAFCHVYDLEPSLKKESTLKYLEQLNLQTTLDNAVVESRKKRAVNQTLSIKLMEFFENVGAL